MHNNDNIENDANKKKTNEPEKKEENKEDQKDDKSLHSVDLKDDSSDIGSNIDNNNKNKDDLNQNLNIDAMSKKMVDDLNLTYVEEDDLNFIKAQNDPNLKNNVEIPLEGKNWLKRSSDDMTENARLLKQGLESLGIRMFDQLNKRDHDYLDKQNIHNHLELMQAIENGKLEEQIEQNPKGNDSVSSHLEKINTKLIATGDIEEKKLMDFLTLYHKVYQEHQNTEPNENVAYETEEKFLEQARLILKTRGVNADLMDTFQKYSPDEKEQGELEADIFKKSAHEACQNMNQKSRELKVAAHPLPVKAENQIAELVKKLAGEPGNPITDESLQKAGIILNSCEAYTRDMPNHEIAEKLSKQLTNALKERGLTEEQIKLLAADAELHGNDKTTIKVTEKDQQGNEREVEKTENYFHKYADAVGHEVALGDNVNLGAEGFISKMYVKLGETFKVEQFDMGDKLNKDNILPSMKILKEMRESVDKFTSMGKKDAAGKVTEEFKKIEKFLTLKGIPKEHIEDVYKTDEKNLAELASKTYPEVLKNQQEEYFKNAPIHLIVKDGNNVTTTAIDTTRRLNIVIDLNERKASIEDMELFDEVKDLAKPLNLDKSTEEEKFISTEDAEKEIETLDEGAFKDLGDDDSIAK